jgi:hypothetical protein
MSKGFRLKTPENLFKFGEELTMLEVFKSSTKEGYVKVREEGDVLILSQGIPRADGKLVALPDEIYTNIEGLVKSINYNLLINGRMNESEINFLTLKNSGVLEREHLYNSIFFHKELKDFIEEILIDKIKNNEIEGVSYYFFENVPKGEFISHIESINIKIESREVSIKFSSLLDGRFNEIVVDLDRIGERFDISKLVKVVEDLSEESVRHLTLFCNYTVLNQSGRWYLERTPLVLMYKNYYSDKYNYLSVYNVFDNRHWNNDIKEFIKVKKELEIKI